MIYIIKSDANKLKQKFLNKIHKNNFSEFTYSSQWSYIDITIKTKPDFLKKREFYNINVQNEKHFIFFFLSRNIFERTIIISMGELHRIVKSLKNEQNDFITIPDPLTNENILEYSISILEEIENNNNFLNMNISEKLNESGYINNEFISKYSNFKLCGFNDSLNAFLNSYIENYKKDIYIPFKKGWDEKTYNIEVTKNNANVELGDRKLCILKQRIDNNKDINNYFEIFDLLNKNELTHVKRHTSDIRVVAIQALNSALVIRSDRYEGKCKHMKNICILIIQDKDNKSNRKNIDLFTYNERLAIGSICINLKHEGFDVVITSINVN